MTSNILLTADKYMLVTSLTNNTLGFSARLWVYSSGTFLYNTILQYLVYNKLDNFIVAMQI
jgi:hypothetical protein